MTVRRLPRIIISLLAIAAAMLAAACGPAAGSSPPSPDPSPSPAPSPEPGRVNIRQGLFSRDAPLGDANFSAVLPEGWSAVDVPARPFPGTAEPPMGAIIKTGTDVTLRYAVLPAGQAEVDARIMSGYSREQVTIGGVTVGLLVPDGFSSPGERYWFQAAFPSVPGDPAKKFSVRFSGIGFALSDIAEARSLIESVRYAPDPPSAPGAPEPQVTPGPDWQRLVAHSKRDPDYKVFSVLAPPGWEFIPYQGIDSFVGTFTNGQISIDFDYGSLSGSLVSPEDHLRDPEYFPEHIFWTETIEGKPFLMFRPVSDEPHERAFTGISAARIPGPPDLVMPTGSYSSLLFACGGSFGSNTADRDEQELVLAILRTLQAEDHPGDCT